MLADAFGSRKKLIKNVMIILFSKQFLSSKFLQVVIDRKKKYLIFKCYFNFIILFFKCKITD